MPNFCGENQQKKKKSKPKRAGELPQHISAIKAFSRIILPVITAHAGGLTGARARDARRLSISDVPRMLSFLFLSVYPTTFMSIISWPYPENRSQCWVLAVFHGFFQPSTGTWLHERLRAKIFILSKVNSINFRLGFSA